ncbi:MAG: PAS domain S-box protein [Phycisphaerae bacterium]|nr:PAS domain S-box protein [Phycisphaerae bacterium]
MVNQSQEDDVSANDADRPDSATKPSPGAGRRAWVPIAVLLTVLACLCVVTLVGARGSSLRAIAGHFAISTLFAGFGACLTAKSFLIHGTPGLLPLGCGIVMWGLAAMASSNTSPQGARLSETVYFSCTSLSALWLVTGASLLLRTSQPLSRRALWLTATYTLAGVAVVGISLLASAGAIPSFFLPDWDTPPMRQPGPVLNIALFVLAALLLGAGAVERRPTSPFTYWSAVIPGLIAAGIFGAKFQSESGVYDRTAYLSQFLSGLYMLLVAVVASQRESRAKEIAVEVGLRKSDELYHLLFENMTEGFFIGEVVYDEEGKPCDYRHVHVNPGHERQTGFKRERVTGRTSRELFFPAPNPMATQKFCEAGHLGRSSHFEIFSQAMGKYLDIIAFPLGKGRFASLTIDITERRLAEEALRQSEAKYRTIVDTATEGILVVGPDALTTFANARMAKMLGYADEELVGRQISDFMFEEDVPDHARRIANRRRGISENYERRFRRKDGQTVWTLVSATPLLDDNQRFQGSFAMFTDITERKEAERKARESSDLLRASEQHLKAVVNGSPIPQFVIGRDHRILYWNRALEEYSGLPAEEMVGTREVWRAFYGSERPCLADLLIEGEIDRIEQLYAGKCSHSRLIEGAFEGVDFFPDMHGGTWLFFTAAPIHGKDGEILGAVETLADVTERKQMENELRKLASVVTHSSELVNLATPDGKMIYLNDAGSKMLGISADEVARTHILEVIPEHLMEKVRNEVLPAMGAGGWEGDLEYKNLQNGTLTAVHAIIFLVTDPKTGAPLYHANVSMDITERNRMEQALRDLNATLESKVVQRTAELEKRTRQLQQLTLQLSQAEDRERTRIGAILHEDFQQQIAGAKLHLSLLSRRVEDNPQQQDIIARVDGILRDAIEQSRSLAHELSPAALSQNDLTEVLRWLATQMNTELGLRVHVNAQDEVTSPSDALTVFLFRAVQEMLRNVARHSKAREATIRTTYHGRYVCISVRDRGTGFNPKELGDGVGFGLMNIRERSEMLGGRLKVRSRKDVGTAMYLTVPNEDTEATDAAVHEVCVQGK